MRALNVVLSVVVSALLFVLVAELGLRVLGFAPQPTIHRFDPHTGWSKLPDASIRRATREFDVTIRTNALGLRDDPLDSPRKPAGARRVLCVGDLFVDLLERWWRAEGRPVDVVNAGTEGWSTDQEAVWIEEQAAAFEPDVVLLFPYENDLYWNGQLFYRRFPKPRFSTQGPRERVVLQDPGPRRARERTALGTFLGGLGEARATFSPDGRRVLDAEYEAYWREPPPEMVQAIQRTRSALQAARDACQRMGARLVVAPIPGKAAVVPAARAALEAQILGLDPLAGLRRWLRKEPDPRTEPRLAPGSAWSPDQPVETFLALCRDLGVETIDARAALRARAGAGESLYYQADWHFDPSGNRAFARVLHDELDARGLLPGDLAPRQAADLAPERPRAPSRAWIAWYLGLVAALGTLYARTYRNVAPWKAVAFVAGMLALVFTIALGGSRLVAHLPPFWGRVVLVLFLAGLLSFVLAKLGRRLGTIAELLWAFTRRGHWYLMPLLVVLLTIGSLLVVAASSPLVAPFIYTLF
jgi:hypothetical protein